MIIDYNIRILDYKKIINNINDLIFLLLSLIIILNLRITTGNNLNIESLQDTYYANIKDNSWNAGASYSNSENTGKPQTSNKNSYGISGGGSSTESNTDSQWVNNQTSIIANNNVNIKVNNNTDLKGGLIASNSDNLNINTGSLTYSDITNFNTTTTKGSGLSTGIGTSADNFFKGTSPNGTTTITNINEGQEKEGTTKATIGKGNITIANNNNQDISDLNRDVNNSNEITKDMITGVLNNTLEIDNRVFTIDGWKSVYGDVVNTPMNAWNATKGALKDTKLTLDITSDVFGAIPLSPVWVSRQKDIPPHPFPSFGIGDEVMGESSFRRDENNKPIPDDGYLNVYTQQKDDLLVSDRNPIFRLLYAFVPGGKSMTDNHDVEMNKLQRDGAKLTGKEDYEIPSSTLKKTILPSFLKTLYGIPGTALDFKNYGENYKKIKDSYDNGRVSNSVIIDKNKNIIKNDWKK